MPSTDSTVRIKADISKLKSEMQAAARQVRLVNSEFKAATAGMDDWSKSEEGLTAKIKQLNGTLDAQRTKLDLLNQEYEQTVKLYGENSAAADKVKISINNQEAAIAKTEKELENYNNQLEELPKTLDKTGDAAEKAADGFTVIKGALADLVADGIRNAISALKDFAKEAIQVGMDFESSMSKVGAVSGASAEEMQALSDKAKEMGESTIFSASQSAEAFNYMAMAGWKTEEMLDGIEGVMNLAAASGADLATTSDIVTDALTAMGYGAKDAGRLADVMAAASSNANTNVEMMGSTFQYAAPIIGTLGMSMEDAAVAIGLMANAGIKGDKAGTALRSTLNRLSAPPKQCATEMEKLGISMTDSEGKMKSLDQLRRDVRKAFSTLSETEATAAAKHIAGAEAMSGLLAIVNAAPADYEKLTKAVNNSAGAAADMAQQMNDNVGGQLTLLKSKIEGIMIKLFERASGSMKKGIETIGQALDKVDWNKVGDQIGKFATKAADFFAYIVSNSSRIISILKTIGTTFAVIFVSQKIVTTASAFSTLITAMTSASSASGALSAAMSTLGISMSALPVMAVVAGLAAVYSYINKQNEALEEAAQATYGLNEKDRELIDTINEASNAMQDNLASRKDITSTIDTESSMLSDLKDRYNELIDENGNVKSGSEELAETLLGQLAEGLGTTIDKVKENIDANGKLSSSIDELIAKKKEEAKFAALEDSYKEAVKGEVDAFKNLKEAKQEQASALEELNQRQEEFNKLNEDLQKADAWGALGMSLEIKEASSNLQAAREKYDGFTTAVGEASETWQQAQSTIGYYQQAMAASTENNTDKMNNALLAWQNGLVDNTMATKEQLEQQVITTKQDLDQIREMHNQGLVNDSVLQDYQKTFQIAGSYLDTWVAQNESAGRDAAAGLKGSTSEGLAGLQDTVESMAGSAYNALETNLGDWGSLAQYKTGDFIQYLKDTEKPAEDEGKNIGDSTANGIKSSDKEFASAADQNVNTFKDTIEGKNSELNSTGQKLPEWVGAGATSNEAPVINAGNWTTTAYGDAIAAKQSYAEGKAKEVADGSAKQLDSAKTEAETSGGNFAQGFINGIGTFFQAAFDKAKELAKSALSGLKKGQEEGSPSKLTYKSGSYFVEGYVNAIEKGTKAAVKAAGKMATDSVNAVKQAQKEGSPSKLTYESGRNFTQGFINGIASLEGQLVTTTKQLVNKTLQQLLALKNFNFSDVTSAASSTFSSGFQKQLDYMIDRINYQNQQMLKDFDNSSAALQAQADAEVTAAQEASQKKQDKIQKKIDKNAEKTQTKATKKKAKKLKKQLDNEKKRLDKATDAINDSYDAQIEEQKKMKEAYQQASQSMISEFTQAMQEYQTAAQKLIDDTMNEIADEYQSQYDALISKQDNLISKLKSAGDLFSLSNSNVMTINDIQAQTAAIKQYAEKLATIKKKVSSDLFDQIASYDMKEGEAFIDRLLSMTDKELQAYSDAYDEKMKVSEDLAQGIYKTDFDKVAADYKTAMSKAFASLPSQLEALGWQSMQGFLSGLTTNTAYMEESVRTFISGMVDTFKKQLGIHSPSKVTMALGELTGEGFADGLKEMVKTVQDAAKDITNTVKDTLDLGDLTTAKSLIGSASGAYTAAGAGNYVGDRTQIINFNQVNNSPKALDRLTIYRQTNNLIFHAKVGLSNV